MRALRAMRAMWAMCALDTDVTNSIIGKRVMISIKMHGLTFGLDLRKRVPTQTRHQQLWKTRQCTVLSLTSTPPLLPPCACNMAEAPAPAPSDAAIYADLQSLKADMNVVR